MLYIRPFASLLLAKRSAPLLFTKFVARIVAAIAVCSIVNYQCAAYAEQNISPANDIKTEVQSQQKASSCESCGAPLSGAVAGNFSLNSEKSKNKSLLTDSLWGNLILELAYERDNELNKLAKKVRLMNAATTVSVLGLAAATMAQGITALAVLNPPYGKGIAGVPDSYAPLNVGVATSGAMMGVMAARLYCGHKLAQHIQHRQIEIRDRVQAVLAHVEYSQGDCLAARSQLTALIGSRACKEWLQLWESSHQKLAGTAPRISLHTDSEGNVLNTTAHSDVPGNAPTQTMVAEAFPKLAERN